MKKFNKLSPEAKAEALAYADAHGTTEASKKYNVSDSTIYTWRSKLKKTNGAVIRRASKPKNVRPEVHTIAIAAPEKKATDLVVVCTTANLGDVLRSLNHV